jgi:hypothetical protein
MLVGRASSAAPRTSLVTWRRDLLNLELAGSKLARHPVFSLRQEHWLPWLNKRSHDPDVFKRLDPALKPDGVEEWEAVAVIVSYCFDPQPIWMEAQSLTSGRWFHDRRRATSAP